MLRRLVLSRQLLHGMEWVAGLVLRALTLVLWQGCLQGLHEGWGLAWCLT
jgi:hypothetical protein